MVPYHLARRDRSGFLQLGIVMATSLAALALGVVLLAWAADQLVLGAARIAVVRRVAPIVVGAVIVGFGTSSPELLVSALAARTGEIEIAVGNIVGSNLVNLTLILGVGVLILPLAVDSRAVRREAPLAVAAMALFALLVQNGLVLWEGLLLVAALAGALAAVIRKGGGDALGEEAVELAGADIHSSREVVRTAIGLAGTLLGARLLLWGAVDLAQRAGLSEGFIGATLVAIGTSLPELVTVIQSARRKEGDLILGNLLGSNLFNALGVGGVAAIVGPHTIEAPALTGFGAIGSVAVGLAVWAMMRTGRRMSRIEGAVLLGAYAAIVPFLRPG